MALNSLRSGWAALEYEIAEERASALGRLGRRLEAALGALAECPPTTGSERTIRDSLVAEARYALAFHRATRGLRSQRQHACDADLRCPQRDFCANGSIGNAQHPFDE